MQNLLGRLLELGPLWLIDWFSVVWHKRQVSRWTFIQWVAILGGLSTRDRLANFILCHGGLESHDHLFFGCVFAEQVWKEVKTFCGFEHTGRNLISELQSGTQHCKGQSLRTSVYGLCLDCLLYVEEDK